MIVQLNRRGTILRSAVGASAALAEPLRSVGTSATVAPAVPVYRRTLSQLGTRTGERQIHKGTT